MSDFKPITTRLREVMRNSLAAGESADTSKWELCVDAPIQLFNNECDIIDSAYVTLEGLYATSCDACDKLDERCTQLKRERDAIAAELDRVQGEEPDLSEYMKLPRDAADEACHVDDEMDGSHGRFRVNAIGGNGELWYFGAESTHMLCQYARDCLHHHNPTVEDVLREFAVAISGQNEGFGALVVAEYADRLRAVMRDDRD